VHPGELKNTYGTGCFALLNAGDRKVESMHGLVTTLACDAKGKPVYSLEGSVFVAGAAIQWLRDALGVIANSAESEARARAVQDNAGVYFVPAFVGLGAPYWDQDARGAIIGLTRGTGREHIIRAALESIAYQTRDLVDALRADLGMGGEIKALKVDGGAAANDFLMQFQADILGVPVVRPKNVETTASGAAYLAGLACGFWKDQAEVQTFYEVDRTFTPRLDVSGRERLYAGWKQAIERVRTKE
jgi:glycerol kinase